MSSPIIEVKLLVSGKPTSEFALDGGSTVADLREAVRQSDVLRSVADKKFQCNGEVLSDASVLTDGARLTIYTKVEGGLN